MIDWIRSDFNDALSFIRLYMGIIYVIVGIIFVFKARNRLFAWPVSALVCLGIVIGGAGVVFFHQSALRQTELPWPIGANDIGTLIVGVILSTVATFLGIRIVRNRLLSDADRQRVKETADRTSS